MPVIAGRNTGLLSAPEAELINGFADKVRGDLVRRRPPAS